jgi:hypothetical protein
VAESRRQTNELQLTETRDFHAEQDEVMQKSKLEAHSITIRSFMALNISRLTNLDGFSE